MACCSAKNGKKRPENGSTSHALLDTDTLEPNPDFYTASLFTVV
jgi:hypothetical protein